MEYKSWFSSPVGTLCLRSDGTALTGLKITSETPSASDSLPLWAPVHSWLSIYFSGRDPGPFPCPLSPAGTKFHKSVWKLLLEIPYGETVSYGFLARRLSPTMSPQAVGRAVGKNPIAIVIPCHRVVGAAGQLTGYAYGLQAKQFLLKLEASH